MLCVSSILKNCNWLLWEYFENLDNCDVFFDNIVADRRMSQFCTLLTPFLPLLCAWSKGILSPNHTTSSAMAKVLTWIRRQ